MQKTILTERMARKEKGLITESLKILTERMIGKDKDIILKAVSLLKHVDEEDHARTLEIFIHQYDEHGDTYELLDSIESDEFNKELTDLMVPCPQLGLHPCLQLFPGPQIVPEVPTTTYKINV